MKSSGNNARRRFLGNLAGVAGLGAVAGSVSPARARQSGGVPYLPAYARTLSYRSLKQSSYDRSGGNHDSWPIEPGGVREVFRAEGPGVISHIWFTISARSRSHLKDIVLRMYWDGKKKPSVETPIGDFFGLNLGDYVHYESAFLGCSPGKSLNCYFAMPYKKSALITVTNEGPGKVGAFYSNIDYMETPDLPGDIVYFHAQYRQATPNRATTFDWKTNGDANRLKNPDGKENYVYVETKGRGHLMGVTLGVLQNQDHWMGEGDDMIFIDDKNKPLIVGTGSEDYFLGSWNFSQQSFAYMNYGAPYVKIPERAGGRYLCYRWHTDNPVTFRRYLKHTMEHGHANHRADNFYSVCYWYQDKPYTDFPKLPSWRERIPHLKAVKGPGGAAEK